MSEVRKAFPRCQRCASELVQKTPSQKVMVCEVCELATELRQVLGIFADFPGLRRRYASQIKRAQLRLKKYDKDYPIIAPLSGLPPAPKGD